MKTLLTFTSLYVFIDVFLWAVEIIVLAAGIDTLFAVIAAILSAGLLVIYVFLLLDLWEEV